MPHSHFSVPLPLSWPKHAKAATLHVISLAHFVLTHVRGWAANSPLHRVRLAAERDRLDSEVAMLREEIRIKDARMAATAPHRRLCFATSSSGRLEVAVSRSTGHLGERPRQSQAAQWSRGKQRNRRRDRVRPSYRGRAGAWTLVRPPGARTDDEDRRPRAVPRRRPGAAVGPLAALARPCRAKDAFGSGDGRRSRISRYGAGGARRGR
jgi:hypothetical protein